MTEPISLFVGTDVYQRAAGAERMIENSLRRNTPGEVHIEWMRSDREAWSWGGQSFGWCTPFSMFRWFIPEFCNYQGRAIYIDADMAIHRDLAELWNHPLPDGCPGAFAGRMPQKADVILWDCANVPRHDTPNGWTRKPDRHSEIGDYDGRISAARKKAANVLRGSTLPEYWDHRDKFVPDGPDRSGIVHWTKLSCQPYHPYKHAFAYDTPYIGTPETAACFWDYLGMSEEEWQRHPDRIPVEPAPA